MQANSPPRSANGLRAYREQIKLLDEFDAEGRSDAFGIGQQETCLSSTVRHSGATASRSGGSPYSARGLFYKSLQRNDFAAVNAKLSTYDADIH